MSSETEGIYFQLDPIRVVMCVVDNRWAQTPIPVSKEQAWAWLYAHVPGIYQNRWQPNFNEHLAVGIRTLIHTMSHVLLRHVEWSGFSQNSVGEYLIPGALSGILYANRYAETKIGGPHEPSSSINWESGSTIPHRVDGNACTIPSALTREELVSAVSTENTTALSSTVSSREQSSTEGPPHRLNSEAASEYKSSNRLLAVSATGFFQCLRTTVLLCHPNRAHLRARGPDLPNRCAALVTSRAAH